MYSSFIFYLKSDIPEYSNVNLGPKKRVEYATKKVADQNPDAKVQLESIVHRKEGQATPHAVTHNILVNGEVKGSVTLLNQATYNRKAVTATKKFQSAFRNIYDPNL